MPADRLLDATRSLAARIALTPSEILTIKKLSINRAMEAMGMRQATAAVSDLDALLHLSPTAVELRRRIKDEGLKPVIDAFRVPPTTDLSGR
jgi:enoyl-CoA hydratase